MTAFSLIRRGINVGKRYGIVPGGLQYPGYPNRIRYIPRVLDRMALEYTILEEGQADVFGNVNITKLAVALDAEQCEITSLREHDESLESYYVSLMGGGSHE